MRISPGMGMLSRIRSSTTLAVILRVTRRRDEEGLFCVCMGCNCIGMVFLGIREIVQDGTVG
jgi:hypothetical protein